MKVLIFCSNGRITKSLSGIEKVYSELANELSRRGRRVAAVYDDLGNDPPIFPIVSQATLVNLNGAKRLPFSLLAAKIWREITKPLRKTFLAPLFPEIYSTLKQRRAAARLDAVLAEFRPDVVVSFELRDAKTLFYRRPQTDFATIQMTHGSPDWILKLLPRDELRATLNRCDVVQTLLPSFVPTLQAVCSTPVVAIPNVVPQFAESVDVDERERVGKPRIVCFGRLDPRQKRQRLAVEAFAQIADACPDWTLHLYGDDGGSGKYQTQLRALIAKLQLKDRVFLHPSTRNVKEELLKSDVFAFPSAFEGFGISLAEALSAGLPAVGFADAPAVNELVIDGENGFLANDVDDFAQKLKTLIESKELRRKFGANAKKSVEKFEASKVWDAWEKLLRETVEKKRAPNADGR